MTCACVNVPMGSYDNQVALMPPWEGARLAGIDRCIEAEILGLWDRGIQTIESCCGHNVAPGYIAVRRPEDYAAMAALGYVRHPDVPHVFLRLGEGAAP